YYASYAETGFVVDPNQAITPQPTQQAVTTAADLYLLPGIAAIIVAITIGFAITIILQRKQP
ncbi:MAG: hypothetical protein ACXV2C_06675, partial [Candidatus Bathyarchaeia archaeon]